MGVCLLEGDVEMAFMGLKAADKELGQHKNVVKTSSWQSLLALLRKCPAPVLCAWACSISSSARFTNSHIL